MSGADRSVRETDDLYAELLDAHAGLSAEESARLDARLILILMSRYVDAGQFREALADARDGDGARPTSE